VVQIVTNSADLQAYAAEQVLIKLREGSAHESMLKISGAHNDAPRVCAAKQRALLFRLPAGRVWAPAEYRAQRILRAAAAALRRVQPAHQGAAAVSVCQGACGLL
jgi:hypothetical protein